MKLPKVLSDGPMVELTWMKRIRVAGKVEKKYEAELAALAADKGWLASVDSMAWLSAPWVASKKIKGERVAWSTKTAHRPTAEIRAVEHFRLLLAGEFCLADRQKARREMLRVSDLEKLYKAWPKGQEYVRKANWNKLIRVVAEAKGCGKEEAAKFYLDEDWGLVLRGWQVKKQREAVKSHGDTRSPAHQRVLRSANSELTQAQAVFCARARQYYADCGSPVPEQCRAFAEVLPIDAMPVEQFVRVPAEVMQRIKAGMESLREVQPGVWAALRVVTETGMRPSDIARTKWADVHGAVGAQMITVRGKSGRTRLINVSDALLADLRDLREDDHEYILPATTDHEREEGVWRAVNDCLKACGMQVQKGKFVYQLRAEWIAAVENAYGLDAAQLGAGHESSATTTGHYLPARGMPGAINVLG